MTVFEWLFKAGAAGEDHTLSYAPPPIAPSDGVGGRRSPRP
jgi:hypothetical protein